MISSSARCSTRRGWGDGRRGHLDREGETRLNAEAAVAFTHERQVEGVRFDCLSLTLETNLASRAFARRHAHLEQPTEIRSRRRQQRHRPPMVQRSMADRSSRLSRSGSARMSISTTLPPAIVKPSRQTGTRPNGATDHLIGQPELRERRCLCRDRLSPPHEARHARNRSAISPQHDRRIQDGDQRFKAPSRTAARNASTTRRCFRRSASEVGAWP